MRPILRLLGDGRVHSGAALGRELGISRTAVWKQLQKIEATGIRLEKLRGVGYRIPGGLELLEAGMIRDQLSSSPAVIGSDIVILDSVDSTNSYLKRNYEGQAVNGIVCLAEQQTDGRGRRGRSWVSPFGKNLYFSTLWSFTGGSAALDGLSLAVAVETRQAITCAVGSDAIQLKWPNDLLLNNRKIGGILLELTGDPTDVCQVIIGIGLNLGMSPNDETREGLAGIGQPWADLGEFGNLSRNQLAAELIRHLLPMLANYQISGFAPYRDQWQRYDAYAGAEVQVSTPVGSLAGRSLGLAANGALRVEIEGEVHSFFGGEVSLRPAQ